MKNKKEIEDRIEDIDNAIDDLVGRGNEIELDKLILKVETLRWIIE